MSSVHRRSQPASDLGPGASADVVCRRVGRGGPSGGQVRLRGLPQRGVEKRKKGAEKRKKGVRRREKSVL